MVKLILLAGAGSFIGGSARFFISALLPTKDPSAFPYATCIVNLLGCLFIGILFGFFEKMNISESWKIFLMVGILGGFTTFSAFSLELMNLLRHGNWIGGCIYISTSVFLGLLATYSGFYLANSIVLPN
jgi:CrcB protein